VGTLFIVPTPIGNLEDITLRALRVLREVALIAAEDTRTSGVLLKHYEITTPTTSYHEHNKLGKLDVIFDALASGDVALISDAGTPGISDPGYELINTALERGYRVEPLPGPNAVIPALVGSGLPTDRFVYAGFLPKKTSAKTEFLSGLLDEAATVIVYESPHRLVDTLATLTDIVPDRPVCVAREISKRFEEFQRGTAAEVHAYYAENPPKGEITLLIGGAIADDDTPWDEARVRAALVERMAGGESRSAAAKALTAQSGWKKRAIYALTLEE